LYVDYVEDYFRKRVYIMAFGKSAVVKSFVSENGGAGKDVFFPTASGKNGATAEYTMRFFPGEDEITYREWSFNDVMVNGQKAWRTCIVGSDNMFDRAATTKRNEVKAQLEADGLEGEALWEALKAATKPLNLKWSKPVFAINVYNQDDGKVQVFKASWEAHKRVDPNGDDSPQNLVRVRQSGNPTLYAELISLLRNGAKFPDPSGKRGAAITLFDPAEFDIVLVCSGQGQQGKRYKLDKGFNLEPLSEEVLALPRWDIRDWVTRAGVWSDAALEDLLNGRDYYETAKTHKIELFPKKFDAVELPVAVTVSGDSEDDGDPLFDE
jgi:hypothetical protein